MTRATAALLALFAWAGGSTARATAQERPVREALGRAVPPFRIQDRGTGKEVAAPLFSLVLPGAGQHVLGQRRKWVYLALELATWTVYFERRSAAAGARERYRDFAWKAGRLRNGARIDGDFAYYETMSRWERSGAFDLDPRAPGVQPELDASTYNGWIWSLASSLFLPLGPGVSEEDPGYRTALAYYEQRAYGSALLWDWTIGPFGGQAEMARLIGESDRRFRQATSALGVLIANHLLSGADAFLSARTGVAGARARLVPGAGGSVRLAVQVMTGSRL